MYVQIFKNPINSKIKNINQFKKIKIAYKIVSIEQQQYQNKEIIIKHYKLYEI